MESTTQKTETKTGRSLFLWHDLLARDAPSAIAFYEDVVGWTTQPYDFEGEPGPEYTMWMAGDVAVGGVMEIDLQTMGEVSPAWSGYVYTPDVDVTIRRAKKLGGDVLGDAMDVPTVGRMACVVDPQGATLWVLAPSSSESMPEPPEVGSFVWNELATTDPGAAFSFYAELFGWELMDEMDVGGGNSYRIFGAGGQMLGGIYNSLADTPPNWLYYVRVDDLETSLSRLTEREGKVLDGPMDVPGGARVARCLDPDGVPIALHELKR